MIPLQLAKNVRPEKYETQQRKNKVYIKNEEKSAYQKNKFSTKVAKSCPLKVSLKRKKRKFGLFLHRKIFENLLS